MTLTAPRLVAALILAAVGYLASETIKPLLPDGTQFGYFSVANAVIGLVVGWVVIGARIGRGMAAAISYGLTGALVLLFWGLFSQAVNEMLRLSLRRRFSGPSEALKGAVDIAIGYAALIATPAVLGTVVLGGIVAAVLAEFSARYWR